MRKISIIASILVLISILLGACNLPQNQQSTDATTNPMAAVDTAAAQTVIALSTQVAQSQVTPATGGQTGGDVPTATVAPTQTSAPTNPALPSLTAVPAQPTAVPPTAVPCDRVEFVTDVTVPDNTGYGPGASFVKTWRIKNVGSCTWTTNYKMVFDSGEAMGGPASVALPGNVAPGQTVDLSVNLTAPSNPNTYQGFWKLQNASGVRFGMGSADKPWWVKIVVGVTPVNFAVTSVNGSADNANWSGSCATAHTVTWTITIKASKAGTVTYYINRSDGANSSTQSVEFTEAGTKTVTYTWTLSSSYEGWIKLYVDNPNHQWFGPWNFKVTCS